MSALSNSKAQSSFLEYECTCAGNGAKQRVQGPKQREQSISQRRGGEVEEALKWSSRARDSVEAPDWHCLQGALKRTFPIKSIIYCMRASPEGFHKDSRITTEGVKVLPNKQRLLNSWNSFDWRRKHFYWLKEKTRCLCTASAITALTTLDITLHLKDPWPRSESDEKCLLFTKMDLKIKQIYSLPCLMSLMSKMFLQGIVESLKDVLFSKYINMSENISVSLLSPL